MVRLVKRPAAYYEARYREYLERFYATPPSRERLLIHTRLLLYRLRAERLREANLITAIADRSTEPPRGAKQPLKNTYSP